MRPSDPDLNAELERLFAELGESYRAAPRKA